MERKTVKQRKRVKKEITKVAESNQSDYSKVLKTSNIRTYGAAQEAIFSIL